ncbi:methylated-DNA--[protein]-cysteine S-methyltransferase [Flagellimonas marinaquae]|uniref:Methylated-DNA--[protein]-cysteine S-methyltransferase n=1 Tax=Flagellimonas aurea TaxID=2915619 RepID=A0ABS3G932_9FLAO|nr:methylated-DNA--[protein]-cysteine S-methyltransferase [Allomuricauda aurea]MAO15995.1 cysteine methyltransferase [Allomuricauda sp.]MBC73831.1 cysteine methyltransferase [Allomuricauda sp.]MBO0355925.1 methylated-DNA--[protein]-cysteine S-methyltransferase [Allomuricauda aurea]UBZ13093.1 methylated-DNA--[protein]-cysteine S-methyltransferase [Allomuricauda aquimarina]|tara:strand:+ start:2516 stop:3361 length:846 start_codon:yes stop_codon:yes gene_type:complete
MNEQEYINYIRIAEAIEYINQNYAEQPTLEEIAKKVHLSPFHFQKMFTEWAGVSPKKFLQFISIQHAKQILKNSQTTLFETAHKTGLSGTGRLHDLFVKIEGMTPGEYKNKGGNLTINYSFAESKFGEVLVASTHKGICYMGFSDNKEIAFSALQKRFSKASFIQQTDEIQQNALQIYAQDWSKINEIKLHLKGTDFQLKVWEALLKIPTGNLATYGNIAKSIKKPNASRAVGTAIGNNPIAFLIPCHRVIQSTGVFGGYKWGTTRKTAIIGWEVSQNNVW